MDKIYQDFKEKDVVFFNLYTREPHPDEKFRDFDFFGLKQTGTHEERVNHARILKEERNQIRPILIDTFGDDCIQNKLGGRKTNSLLVIDKESRVALWQEWSHADKLRSKLEEMTGTKKDK